MAGGDLITFLLDFMGRLLRMQDILRLEGVFLPKGELEMISLSLYKCMLNICLMRGGIHELLSAAGSRLEE